MGRPKRKFIGNQVYHLLNRANGRATIFRKAEDYRAFERILEDAVDRFALRLCCYCLMPNHWHMVVWPRKDRGMAVSHFMQWLTLTHTQRWHAHNHTTGTGHLYQGRFKSFPVQGDGHVLKVFRYIEQNALRAELVERAQDWPYGSLWRRNNPQADDRPLLVPWPVAMPRTWDVDVNVIPDEAELAALRLAAGRGRPYGSASWAESAAARMGLQSTLRPPGRPKKDKTHRPGDGGRGSD